VVWKIDVGLESDGVYCWQIPFQTISSQGFAISIASHSYISFRNNGSQERVNHANTDSAYAGQSNGREFLQPPRHKPQATTKEARVTETVDWESV